MSTQLEKVTFNIPSDLKKEVALMKEEMQISFNSLYQKAIKEFLEKREIQKWQSAANAISEEYEKNEELREWTDFQENIYEY